MNQQKEYPKGIYYNLHNNVSTTIPEEADKFNF